VVDSPNGATSGVRVNRFSLSNDDAAPAETEAETPVDDPDAPAIKRFAAAATNPDGLPEMAIVLTDDGTLDGAIPALASLSFPVSVMLDPLQDGAEDRMNAYRDAGFEVGLIADLPPSATAQDAAVYFEVALGALPEAIAVLDATGETQSDAEVVQQTIAALSRDGLGLLTVPRGLNTAPRVAADRGVAAGVIFRELDTRGEEARTIQRYIDQAAFRARQTTAVILLGQLRPETLRALIAWSETQARGGQIAVVPVSTVMTDDG